MEQTGYYTHIDKQRYRCTVLEVAQTQVRIRLSAETAQELKLAEELWLPRSYVKVEN